MFTEKVIKFSEKYRVKKGLKADGYISSAELFNRLPKFENINVEDEFVYIVGNSEKKFSGVMLSNAKEKQSYWYRKLDVVKIAEIVFQHYVIVDEYEKFMKILIGIEKS